MPHREGARNHEGLSNIRRRAAPRGQSPRVCSGNNRGPIGTAGSLLAQLAVLALATVPPAKKPWLTPKRLIQSGAAS